MTEMGAHAAADKVMRVSRTAKVRTDKVTLRDYNPEKPKLKLEATVPVYYKSEYPAYVDDGACEWTAAMQASYENSIRGEIKSMTRHYENMDMRDISLLPIENNFAADDAGPRRTFG